MRALSIKSYEFRREREQSWRELERLVSKVEHGGMRLLSAEELSRLPILYRSALSSLSVARSISLDRNLLEYLENLTSRAYLCVYGVRRRFGGALITFFIQSFPQAVRDLRWTIPIAALILVLGALTGLVLTDGNLDRFYQFVPETLHQGRTPTSSPEELREGLFDTDASVHRLLLLFATFLFTHNSQVGILAFSLGFVVGLPVFYLLFTNGLILGAFGALYRSHGLSTEFWGWVLPHGITELGAVVLCGAAGLSVSRSLLFPGAEKRLRNLARQGRRAGLVVLGAVALFLVAALIEGFFRQLVHSTPVRYSVALLSAIGWMLYFTRVGRRVER
jgi:uncharacterized membrane protein SpoIIM required for sporulation